MFIINCIQYDEVKLKEVAILFDNLEKNVDTLGGNLICHIICTKQGVFK